MDLINSLTPLIPQAAQTTADLPRIVSSAGLWFLVGLLLGILVRFFVNKVAKWLGAGLLVLFLLVGLGIVYVNTNNVSYFFVTISEWLIKLLGDVGKFASLDRITTIALIAGLAMSIYYRSAAKGD